ncbi:hypothetical protein Q9966_001584 [Columba livia]|nr:hypothetical protein Q9966_001584 [Columba livia]
MGENKFQCYDENLCSYSSCKDPEIIISPKSALKQVQTELGILAYFPALAEVNLLSSQMGDAWGCYLNLGPGDKEPDMSWPSTPAADMCDAPPVCTGGKNTPLLNLLNGLLFSAIGGLFHSPGLLSLLSLLNAPLSVMVSVGSPYVG